MVRMNRQQFYFLTDTRDLAPFLAVLLHCWRLEQKRRNCEGGARLSTGHYGLHRSWYAESAQLKST
jgi:hypothetical protein